METRELIFQPEVPPPRIATLTLTNGPAISIVKINGETVIDATAKPKPRGGVWVDPNQSHNFGSVIVSIQETYSSARYYNDVNNELLRQLINMSVVLALRKLNFKVDGAQVKGEIPDNWKLNTSSQKPHRNLHVLSLAEWQERKAQLMSLIAPNPDK